MKRGLLLLLLMIPGAAQAAAYVDVCYNYGCLHQDTVVISETELAPVLKKMRAARDAAAERTQLAETVAEIYGILGKRTPIAVDRGGNLNDPDSDGKMDCIDHSITTHGVLKLLETRNVLRFHRVIDRVDRGWVLSHWSAAIQDKATQAKFAVDTWYRHHGKAALVVPMRDWEKDRINEPVDNR